MKKTTSQLNFPFFLLTNVNDVKKIQIELGRMLLDISLTDFSKAQFASLLVGNWIQFKGVRFLFTFNTFLFIFTLLLYNTTLNILRFAYFYKTNAVLFTNGLYICKDRFFIFYHQLCLYVIRNCNIISANLQCDSQIGVY